MLRRTVALPLREMALMAVLFVSISLSAVGSGVARPLPSGPDGAAPAANAGADATAAALALLFFCVLATTTFSWMILRSRSWGWKLVATVFLAYFGLGTVLPQIESAVFLPRQLPPGLVTRLFVMGALAAGLFAPAAVLILGRFRGPAGPEAAPTLPRMKLFEWASRIALLAVIHVAIYFLAGYFIAFRNPELVAYYGDTDPGSFAAQILKVWRVAPWLFALQLFRGVLWVAVALPVILAFRGRRFELAFLIGCLFAVWSAMLLAPNPYMPYSVRMTHLVETAPSLFLFGCLTGFLLGQRG